MRVVIDYRAALRARTGVGELAHELARALAADPAIDVTLFSSSWKDRPDGDTLRELAPAGIVDRRIPVRLLNLAWHRLEWPPIERLARASFDVAHSMHPLLMPAAGAARVVTIPDLHVLDAPAHAAAEIRRDYPALVGTHAARADLVVVLSRHTRDAVRTRLGLRHDRVVICSPGAPAWASTIAARREPVHLLFVGTLEPRKNVGVLLDAYERLTASRPEPPPLILAGKTTPWARGWIRRLAEPPLAGRVRHVGYVDRPTLLDLLRRARLLVAPSLDEGFGMQALEAMACGVPVVASTAGSLPEVIGEAGLLVDPYDADGLAAAIARVLDDTALAETLSARGRRRAAAFTWTAAARALREGYELAITHRRTRSP